jgi:hypothetical protein
MKEVFVLEIKHYDPSCFDLLSVKNFVYSNYDAAMRALKLNNYDIYKENLCEGDEEISFEDFVCASFYEYDNYNYEITKKLIND